MPRPYLTVLIDTYNHERFIAHAIESVLEQDIGAREMEVLVVDDGSTDGTGAVVQKFLPRVRHLRKPNGGQASAFNAGIPEARGEIIAFLDGDDWWAREKLASVLETLGKHPEVGVVGHGICEVAEDGRESAVFVPDGILRLDLNTVEGALRFRQVKCFLGTSRFTARKQVLEQVLPIPEALVIEADEFMFTMAVAVGGALLLDKPLFYYRMHGGNLFQFRTYEESSFRRKSEVLNALAGKLPSRLAAVGVAPEVADAVLEHIRIDADQHRLALDGGKPWETFRTERAAFRVAYDEAGLGYRLFKGAVLGATLLMPPRRFYQLKRWYADRGLRKWRRLAGEPVPAAPVICIPPAAQGEGRVPGK